MTPPPLSVIGSDLVRELGNHLWQSTLFAGVAALLAFTLRKYEARIRYWVWLAASVKFLIPFSLLIAFGAHLMRPNPPTESQTTVYVAVDEMSQPFTMSNEPAVSAPAQPAAYILPRVRLLDVLAVIWLCGFFVVLAYRCLQWHGIAKAIRNSEALYKGREIDALRSLEWAAGIPRPMRVVSMSDSMEPGVFGFLRPVLLWPRGISVHLDNAQLEAVIAHEVSHVQRRDSVTSAIHMLVEALFWFYPLVWWMEKQLVKERERACDEAVLDLCNRPKEYAESILKICEFCVESPHPCVSGITSADLKKRIGHIMKEQWRSQLSWRKKLLVGAVGLTAFTVPMVIGVAQSALHSLSQQSPATTPATVSLNNVLGTWQGTMHTPGGHDQRLVLKIVDDKTGGLSAELYNLDQSGPPISDSSVSFENGTLRFVNDFPGLKYQGKMSADGKEIRGIMTPIAHPQPVPLELERATLETEWATPAAPAPIQAMALDAKPGVEVATVKPTRPGTRMFMLMIRGSDVVVQNFSLTNLIKFAYQVQNQQIFGAPSWMDSDKWDIEAKPDVPGTPSVEQEREILQKLFAERFALKIHDETREMTGYILTVGKSGPKMTKSVDASLPPNFYMQPFGVLHVQHATLGDFTRALRQNVLDRPVVNQTGLTGKWDFILRFDGTPYESQFPGMPAHPLAADDTNAPSLFTAIHEQLGLELKAQKMPVPVLVIDHVEKPSPN